MSSLSIKVKIAIILLCTLLLSRSSVRGQQQVQIIFPWWGGDIYMMNADGGNVTLLASGTIAYEVFWSPDGSKIAYTGGPDETDFEIFVMNADGSDPIRLTDNDSNDTGLAWSPDGSKIAFTSIRDGNLEIYVMNADGTNQVNLTNHPARDVDPSWSPDGSKIVFASQRDGGNYELYIMNADGSSPVRLTNDPALDDHPIWSPDGSAIAFRRIEVGESCSRVYKINPDGTNIIALTGDVCELNRITWLADSSRVLYQQHFDIYAVHLDASSQEIIATFPSNGALVGIFDLYQPASPPISCDLTIPASDTATSINTNSAGSQQTPCDP